MSGKFITFEGADGVGKTTQVKLLQDYLEKSGIAVITTREPGGDDFSEGVRNILKSNFNIDSITETLLLFAARREHFLKNIKPNLDKNIWVLCDRFYDSTLVYQGKLKNVSIEQIMNLKQFTIDDFEPDATIVLDLDFSSSQSHITSRSLTRDSYDMMEQEKYQIIQNGFRKISEIFSDRCSLVRATGSKLTVAKKIIKALRKKDWFK